MKREKPKTKTIKSKWWYYKGSDIMGEGREKEVEANKTREW